MDFFGTKFYLKAQKNVKLKRSVRVAVRDKELVKVVVC